MIDATLILVNYRTEAHVLATLRHLSKCSREMPVRLIVVDNSASTYLAEEMAMAFPQVQYLFSSHNLGFAGGVNLGLMHAEGEFIILLNPDAHPERGCLSGLMSVLAAEPEAAAAGPKLIPFTPKEPLCPSATWRDPDLLTALVEYTPCRRMFAERWLWDHYWIDPNIISYTTSCAMVQGACLVIKKSWLERVEWFDSERFFLYFEETDFCRRIRQKGGSVLYCPQFVCRHQGGVSLDGRGQDTVRFWKSFYNFHAKHYGPVYAVLVRGLLTAGLAGEYLMCWLKQQLGHSTINAEFDEYVKLVAERLRCQLGCQFDDA